MSDRVELKYGDWFSDQKRHLFKEMTKEQPPWGTKTHTVYKAACGKTTGWVGLKKDLVNICLICYKYAKKNKLPIIDFGMFVDGEVLRINGVNYIVNDNLKLSAEGDVAPPDALSYGRGPL